MNDLSPTDMKPVGPGHNGSPEPLEPINVVVERPDAFDKEALQALWVDVNAFADTAGQWLDLKEIKTQQEADLISDYITGARKKFTQIETARKDAKKPFMDAASSVDTAYNPPKSVLERSVARLKPMLEAFMRAEQKRLDDDRAAAAKIAKEKADKAAADLLAAQKRNDVAGEVAAEAAAKEAAKETKVATKVQKVKTTSATGGGRAMAMRYRRVVEVTNVRALFMHYQDRPEVHDLLTRLANAEANTAGFEDTGTIPGCVSPIVKVGSVA